jgi:Tfp pilus assembly protein PilN
MWLVAAGMLGLPVAFTAPMVWHRYQLTRLQGQIQSLVPKKAALDQLQRLTRSLQAQEAAFRKFGKGQGSWAKRLNILSNLTPEGVWFSELALNPDQGLSLQGLAIAQGGAEMVSIGRLVQELKANPDFASAVKEIQIDSIKRSQEKDIELVQFTLTCPLVGAQGR